MFQRPTEKSRGGEVYHNEEAAQNGPLLKENGTIPLYKVSKRKRKQ